MGSAAMHHVNLLLLNYLLNYFLASSHL